MRYGELVDFCWGACLGRFVTGDTGRWLVIAIEYLGEMKLAPCLTKRLGGGFWISRLGLLADQEMLANVSTEQKNERLAGEASVVCTGSALQHFFRPIRACQLRTGSTHGFTPWDAFFCRVAAGSRRVGGPAWDADDQH